jgi:ribose transport system ATP-binding protein
VTPQVPVLAVEALAKAFGATQALDGVSLEVHAGEVHGLVGQNGSGKSTLIKVLSGYHAADGGMVRMHGELVKLPIAHGEAQRLGVAFVHQDLGLVGTMSVLENLHVGRYRTAAGRRIRWRAERERTRRLLRRFDLELAPDTPVDRLSQAERAIVAIMRALDDVEAHRGSGLLILDEPTAALPAHEVHRLFAAVRTMAGSGSGVLIVTHNLDEVFSITSAVTVLRDGRVVASRRTAELDEGALIDLIVGRELAQAATRHDSRAGATTMEVSGLRGELVHDVGFEARAGEILGLTGLVGAGHQEVGHLIAGARPAAGGTITIEGRRLESPSPQRALAAGVVLLPADRQRHSAILGATVKENVTLPALKSFRGRLGRLDHRAERAAVGDVLRRFEVHPREPERPMMTLSGGNQQKALLGRCLRMRPRVLLLHEPTQGVDVGARQGIFETLRAAADGGAAVVYASVEYEELANICDRVLVFRRGRVVADLEGAECTQEAIMAHCYQTAAA